MSVRDEDAETGSATGSPQSGPIATTWSSRIAPVVYDPFLWLGELRGLSATRREVVGRAGGRVLELGAGTGLNLKHYPAGLQELVLTEPEPGMASRLERRRKRVAPASSRVLEAPAEQLPFDARSFDSVVSTLVFCTVPDPATALREARRVLVDGGQLLFIEHVRAAEGSSLERWQQRLYGPWRVFANGCRCNQDTLRLIAQAGFSPNSTEDHWRGMPPIVRPLIYGQAQAI